MKKNEKVIIGMSGGVDSSVSAAILKKKGYELHGVFLRLWKEDNQSFLKDEKAARQVAKQLGIKFKVVFAQRRFKKEVVKYFLDEYAAGRTPNPCIYCNENFKFKILFEEAKKIKADWVATGHYAKIKKEDGKNKHNLFRAKDKNKDQSYFLYRLRQKELGKIIFPLGGYDKSEVRQLAKKFKLPVYEKKESQDVCFLCNKTTGEFLKDNLKLKKGKVVDSRKNIIGEHRGLTLYTLGQRKGINIGGEGPYYVIGKNYKKNQLIVSNKKEEKKLFSLKAFLKKVVWTTSQPKLPLKAKIQTRYQSVPIYATIAKKQGKYEIIFEEPQRAVTSGQSTVFHGKRGEILGGGIISG